MASKIKGLLMWCKKVTEGYHDAEVTDFTKSWRSGLAFCAIIHHFRPDLIDYGSLSRENIYENNHLAFTVAEKELDIPSLLEASDMVSLRTPDRLSIITYVSQYYSKLSSLPQLGAPRVKKMVATAKTGGTKRHLTSEFVSEPESKKHLQVDQLKNSVNTGSRSSGDKCCICSSRVYLLERLIEDGSLYHRSCFRHSSLSSSSTVYTCSPFPLPSLEMAASSSSKCASSPDCVSGVVSSDGEPENQIVFSSVVSMDKCFPTKSSFVDYSSTPKTTADNTRSNISQARKAEEKIQFPQSVTVGQIEESAGREFSSSIGLAEMPRKVVCNSNQKRNAESICISHLPLVFKEVGRTDRAVTEQADNVDYCGGVGLLSPNRVIKHTDIELQSVENKLGISLGRLPQSDDGGGNNGVRGLMVDDKKLRVLCGDVPSESSFHPASKESVSLMSSHRASTNKIVYQDNDQIENKLTGDERSSDSNVSGLNLTSFSNEIDFGNELIATPCLFSPPCHLPQSSDGEHWSVLCSQSHEKPVCDNHALHSMFLTSQVNSMTSSNSVLHSHNLDVISSAPFPELEYLPKIVSAQSNDASMLAADAATALSSNNTQSAKHLVEHDVSRVISTCNKDGISLKNGDNWHTGGVKNDLMNLSGKLKHRFSPSQQTGSVVFNEIVNNLVAVTSHLNVSSNINNLSSRIALFEKMDKDKGDFSKSSASVERDGRDNGKSSSLLLSAHSISSLRHVDPQCKTLAWNAISTENVTTAKNKIDVVSASEVCVEEGTKDHSKMKKELNEVKISAHVSSAVMSSAVNRVTACLTCAGSKHDCICGRRLISSCGCGVNSALSSAIEPTILFSETSDFRQVRFSKTGVSSADRPDRTKSVDFLSKTSNHVKAERSLHTLDSVDYVSREGNDSRSFCRRSVEDVSVTKSTKHDNNDPVFNNEMPDIVSADASCPETTNIEKYNTCYTGRDVSEISLITHSEKNTPEPMYDEVNEVIKESNVVTDDHKNTDLSNNSSIVLDTVLNATVAGCQGDPSKPNSGIMPPLRPPRKPDRGSHFVGKPPEPVYSTIMKKTETLYDGINDAPLTSTPVRPLRKRIAAREFVSFRDDDPASMYADVSSIAKGKSIGPARPPLPTTANLKNSVNTGSRSSGDKCCICSSRVYLLERLIEDGSLYHRSCFRHSSLSSSSTVYTCSPFPLPSLEMAASSSSKCASSPDCVSGVVSSDGEPENQIVFSSVVSMDKCFPTKSSFVDYSSTPKTTADNTRSNISQARKAEEKIQFPQSVTVGQIEESAGREFSSSIGLAEMPRKVVCNSNQKRNAESICISHLPLVFKEVGRTDRAVTEQADNVDYCGGVGLLSPNRVIKHTDIELQSVENKLGISLGRLPQSDDGGGNNGVRGLMVDDKKLRVLCGDVPSESSFHPASKESVSLMSSHRASTNKIVYQDNDQIENKLTGDERSSDSNVSGLNLTSFSNEIDFGNELIATPCLFSPPCHLPQSSDGEHWSVLCSQSHEKPVCDNHALHSMFLTSQVNSMTSSNSVLHSHNLDVISSAPFPELEYLPKIVSAQSNDASMLAADAATALSSNNTQSAKHLVEHDVSRVISTCNKDGISLKNGDNWHTGGVKNDLMNLSGKLKHRFSPSQQTGSVVFNEIVNNLVAVTSHLNVSSNINNLSSRIALFEKMDKDKGDFSKSSASVERDGRDNGKSSSLLLSAHSISSLRHVDPQCKTLAWNAISTENVTTAKNKIDVVSASEVCVEEGTKDHSKMKKELNEVKISAHVSSAVMSSAVNRVTACLTCAGSKHDCICGRRLISSCGCGVNSALSSAIEPTILFSETSDFRQVRFSKTGVSSADRPDRTKSVDFLSKTSNHVKAERSLHTLDSVDYVSREGNDSRSFCRRSVEDVSVTKSTKHDNNDPVFNNEMPDIVSADASCPETTNIEKYNTCYTGRDVSEISLITHSEKNTPEPMYDEVNEVIKESNVVTDDHKNTDLSNNSSIVLDTVLNATVAGCQGDPSKPNSGIMPPLRPPRKPDRGSHFVGKPPEPVYSTIMKKTETLYDGINDAPLTSTPVRPLRKRIAAREFVSFRDDDPASMYADVSSIAKGKSIGPARPPLPTTANMPPRRLSSFELQKQLLDIDDKLCELELNGRRLEQMIRNVAVEEEDGLMIDWFQLVSQKNQLVRMENDLVYKSREQNLEDEQGRIEAQLLYILSIDENDRSLDEKEEELCLISQKLQIVNRRSFLVDSIDNDKRSVFSVAFHCSHGIVSTEPSQWYEAEDRDVSQMLEKKELSLDMTSSTSLDTSSAVNGRSFSLSSRQTVGHSVFYS